jgi:hypothetical protein
VARIAIISDIHGNGVALDAVLADIARDDVDNVVNSIALHVEPFTSSADGLLGLLPYAFSFG